MCAEWRAESGFTLERQTLILKGLLVLPRAPQLACGFPCETGTAGVQRSHGLQNAVPKSQRNWMQVRPQPPWEAPAGSPGCPGVSGSLAFVALLQTTPREVPGVELLEQHLGKECKQHPDNLCERIHSLGSAQSWNQHPQDMSSLAPALSAWTNHSQRDSGHPAVATAWWAGAL